MTTGDTADIVLVGDGLAAMAVLCSLRRSRSHILVLSHGTPPRPDNRGLALSLSSKTILDDWGIWTDLAGHCQPIERIRISEQNRVNAVWLKTTDIGQPALGYVVPAHALYAALSNSARATPHQVIGHSEIRELHAIDDEIRVGSDTANKQGKLKARLLVAADGFDSATVRLAGAVVKTRNYRQTAIVTDVADSNPHDNTAHEHFTRNGPRAVLPLPANRRKLVLTVDQARAEQVMALPERDFLAHFVDCPGVRSADWYDMGKRVAYPLRKKRLLTGQAQGRWLAVGDAAHTMHPNAAQGFNLCLRDIACLAKQVSGSDRAELGNERWLAAYHDLRRQDRARTLLLADGLAHLYGSDRFMPRVLRRLGMLAIHQAPPIRRSFLQQATGMAGIAVL